MLETTYTKKINAKGLCGSLITWKTSQDLLSSNSAARHNKAIATKNEITPLLEECDDLLGGPGEIKGYEV